MCRSWKRGDSSPPTARRAVPRGTRPPGRRGRRGRGPGRGDRSPGGQPLFVEGEDDALSVHLGSGQPAQTAAGVGGYEGCRSGVAAEAGQRPDLAQAVGETIRRCARPRVAQGPFLLSVQTEAAAPDRELLRGFGEPRWHRRATTRRAQVDLSRTFRASAREASSSGHRWPPAASWSMRPSEASVSSLIMPPGRCPPRGIRRVVEQKAASSRAPRRPRSHAPAPHGGFAGLRDVQGRVDDRVVDVSAVRCTMCTCCRRSSSRPSAARGLRPSSVRRWGEDASSRSRSAPQGLPPDPVAPAAHRERTSPVARSATQTEPACLPGVVGLGTSRATRARAWVGPVPPVDVAEVSVGADANDRIGVRRARRRRTRQTGARSARSRAGSGPAPAGAAEQPAGKAHIGDAGAVQAGRTGR